VKSATEFPSLVKILRLVDWTMAQSQLHMPILRCSSAGHFEGMAVQGEGELFIESRRRDKRRCKKKY